jgi:hypothetical protein
MPLRELLVLYCDVGGCSLLFDVDVSTNRYVKKDRPFSQENGFLIARLTGCYRWLGVNYNKIMASGQL